jgi:hydroxybutyrate-dimer hydrolase
MTATIWRLRMMIERCARIGALTATALLAACGPGTTALNEKPSYVGTVTVTAYSGSDDLLTAGLGWDGLASATAPVLSATPNVAELRRRAIYNNYRALVDFTSAGGYGVLYGPNVSLAGAVDATPGAGKIPGKEYVAFSDDGSGRRNVTLLVQLPDNFDKSNPCIVSAASSGSRGVYGAIAAVGEWGLKRRCAVAYTDKGTGNGAHELGSDTVTLIDGRTDTAAAAAAAAQFRANVTAADRAAFNANFPNRYAFKHAHSQLNPEKDWGLFTRQAIEFALYAVNEEFGDLSGNRRAKTFRPENTIVIAAGVSNGGGAALAAAEQDTTGLIDAVVVGEPQVNLQAPANLGVNRGGAPVSSFARPLYDYTTLADLYQPCAAYAGSVAGAPLLSGVNAASAQNRCARLAFAGLVGGSTFASQATSALAQLRAAGWEAESDLLHASHFAAQATPGVAVTYANAYARASVLDNLCGFSFATTNAAGAPAAPLASPMPTIFAQGNGVPPTAGIDIVYNLAAGGPLRHMLADDDFAFNGAQCLRNLWTGTDALADRVRTGVSEVLLTGNLRGKPALIVHGRSDALVPVNHTSRPYFAMNRLAEGGRSRLSLIEVTNAQHFDTFIAQVPGYDALFVPLHYYNVQALNLMWNVLKSNGSLPPPQVVRTTPRGPGAPPLTSANVPPISLTPPTANQITFAGATVNVPN